MLKKGLKVALIAVLLLIAVLIVKTFLFSSRQLDVQPALLPEIKDAVSGHLSAAIRYPTISYWDAEKTDTAVFAAFHRFLAATFPKLYSTATVQSFNGHALLFKFEGKTAEQPFMLLAHQDVVPVDTTRWGKAPFGGENDGTYIWGRGTLDDKGSLMAILEAVELLLNEGYLFQRSFYLAFGNDEEVRGKGAAKIATYLENQGVTAECIIDEGLVITKGIVPMVNQPVALIGTAEKGAMSIKLSCELEGGHAAMPNNETAVSVLSKAIVNITEKRLKARITPPVNDFLNYLGPEVKWPVRIVFANQWLFKNIITGIYRQSNSGNALVSTTIAPTVIKAGVKDNVLPVYAEAIINMRMLPGESAEKVVKHLKTAINDDRVNIEFYGEVIEASPVSEINTGGFGIINKTIKEQYAGTLVVPTLMTAISDGRHYSKISKNIYRFAPYQMEEKDLPSIHGVDERIKIEDYKAMIRFYYRLIQNFNQ